MKPIILGQAPSAKGDGRHFTGPSGATLCRWAGVETRDELLGYFELDNILPQPLVLNPDENRRRSGLSNREAKLGAMNFLGRTRLAARRSLGAERYSDFIDTGHFVTVVLGAKVWRAFGLAETTEMFGSQFLADDFLMIRFPHPSGLNRELNDPKLFAAVCRNLRSIGKVTPTVTIDLDYPIDPNAL